MIRITQLKLSINHTPEELSQKIRKELRLKNEGFTYEIVKQSLDCRHKEDKKFVYTVDVSLQDKNQESKILQKVHNNNIMLIQKKEYIFPSPGEEELKYPPVIVGSGPAGIFCAWYLARAGYRPLVLERGEEAHVRQKTVENFWKNGVLDPDSNVQFGEGGAGTFSDGKLNTLVKDPSGRNHEVLKRFVQAGAPSEIIYQQKPHLGTDVLVGVVETLRHEIEEMGGEFQFRSKVTDLFFENSQLKEIEINTDIINKLSERTPAVGDYEKAEEMLKNINNEFKNISEIAEIYGVSESSMKRCFKSISGASLGTFMKRKRMEAAAELLRSEPTLSVGEIASLAGYENQGKFSGAFKSVYEMTPIAYRLKYS